MALLRLNFLITCSNKNPLFNVRNTFKMAFEQLISKFLGRSIVQRVVFIYIKINNSSKNRLYQTNLPTKVLSSTESLLTLFGCFLQSTFAFSWSCSSVTASDQTRSIECLARCFGLGKQNPLYRPMITTAIQVQYGQQCRAIRRIDWVQLASNHNSLERAVLFAIASEAVSRRSIRPSSISPSSSYS